MTTNNPGRSTRNTRQTASQYNEMVDDQGTFLADDAESQRNLSRQSSEDREDTPGGGDGPTGGNYDPERSPLPPSRGDTPRIDPENPRPADKEPDIKDLLAALVRSTANFQDFMSSQRSIEPRVKFEEPRVKEPDVFKGRRSEVNNFITQCMLVFSLQPTRFKDESTKIRYELSLFREAPLAAVQPYLMKDISEQPLWLTSLERLHEYIRTNYGDPDERGTAERKLQTLRQTGSASAYFAEFQQYSAVLGWDDEPLVALAIRGLSEYIKDLLAQRGTRITSMPELIEVVVNLDNRREERQREKKHQQQGTYDTRDDRSYQPRKDNRGPQQQQARAPRQEDHGSQRNRNDGFQSRGGSAQPPRRSETQPSRGIRQFRKLSEEDKAGRRARGECLYCGKQGHILVDCPSRLEQGFAGNGRSNNTGGQQRQSSPDQSKVSAPAK
jgi:hypothetical protein